MKDSGYDESPYRGIEKGEKRGPEGNQGRNHTEPKASNGQNIHRPQKIHLSTSP